MTDTELILSKIDELRTELKGDIAGLRTELKGDIAVLDTKIEAVQLGIVQLNDKLEFIEYGLQKEIETTYDLATENAEKISILMADREKARKRKAKLRLISDYRR
ncbi:MAG: hypothetical protein ACI4ER_06785 [Suilimivivens sp.]